MAAAPLAARFAERFGNNANYIERPRFNEARFGPYRQGPFMTNDSVNNPYRFRLVMPHWRKALSKNPWSRGNRRYNTQHVPPRPPRQQAPPQPVPGQIIAVPPPPGNRNLRANVQVPPYPVRRQPPRAARRGRGFRMQLPDEYGFTLR